MADFISSTKRSPKYKSPRHKNDRIDDEVEDAPFQKPKGRNVNKSEKRDSDEDIPFDEGDEIVDLLNDIEEFEEEVYEEELDIALSKLTLSKYKKKVELIISQFFVHGDFEEITKDIIDIHCPEYSYELVKRMISMSFDKTDRERELVSKFLSNSYPEPLSSNMIGKGFERLFEIMDEIERDVPTVQDMLSKYLARAVLDEVLPPAFLSDPVIMNLGGDVVEHAKRMLSREHSGARLESCWGPGDGRPVKELKNTLDQLLAEYLISNNLSEAQACIQELNSQYFFHEIVKRAVTSALDEPFDNQLSISRLLQHLFVNGNLSTQQAVIGFNKLFFVVNDLALDTPAAPQILQAFRIRAIADGVLPADYTPPATVSVDINIDNIVNEDSLEKEIGNSV